MRIRNPTCTRVTILDHNDDRDERLGSPLRGLLELRLVTSGCRPRLRAVAASWLFGTAGRHLVFAALVVLVYFTVMAQQGLAWQVPASPTSVTVISRTPNSYQAFVLRQYRFDEQWNLWTRRDRNHPFTENMISECGWEFGPAFPVYQALCARRVGEKEFRIFTAMPQSTLKPNCYGTQPTCTSNMRRFAYLRDSNAYIGHRPFFQSSIGGQVFEGEASTLLDRNVHAITWTRDGRNIVYCRSVDGGYELVAYNLGDDDYTVLLKFPKSETQPLLGSDATNGVYLVTEGNTVRRISIPITASRQRFDSLASIPVMHRTGKSQVVCISEDDQGNLRLFETDPGGSQYETVLKVETAAKDSKGAK